MWSKISQALRSRSETDPSPSHVNSDVLSKVYEQHPNLSVFHTASDHPFSSQSPPSSPSKYSRRGMFRRISKLPMGKTDDNESVRAPSPIRFPLGISKKVKPTLGAHSNSSQPLLSCASSDTVWPDGRSPRASHDTPRSLNAILRRASQDLLGGLSQDTLNDPARQTSDTPNPPHRVASPTPRDTPSPSDNVPTPLTPLDIKSNSVRSILRDPNTPGTGQNVRFFSRDAYKVISPDVSVVTDTGVEGDKNDIGFMEKLQPASSTPAIRTRPSVAEIFSNADAVKSQEDTEAKSLTSITMPAPPPDISKYFDMSQDHGLPTIPLGLDIPLLDTAIEMSTVDEGSSPSFEPATGVTSTPYKSKSIPPVENLSPSLERSQPFSFSKTIFYSTANSVPFDSNNSHSPLPADLKNSQDTQPSPIPPPTQNRSRALSDTVFQTVIRPTRQSPPGDINDESSHNFLIYSTSTPEPDPFRANATTYYTPQTMIPSTPPQGKPKHAKTASRGEDLIATLRTQLALQSELCTQYEVDLCARDELVEVLGRRAEAAEREGEKRRNVLKGWKKKVAELERVCRHLEEEVDQSRQESVERSVMDEASGEALRMLHQQIATLEREKIDSAIREAALRHEMATVETLLKEKRDDVQRLNDTLCDRNESEKALRNGIRDAREQMELMGRGRQGGRESMPLVMEAEQQLHGATQPTWDEERVGLDAQICQLQKEKVDSDVRLNDMYQQLKTREDELTLLKNELEAQWRYTEATSGKTERLEKQRDELREERDALRSDQQALEGRVSQLEVKWTKSENRKNELESEIQDSWSVREALEKEKDELDRQLKSQRGQIESLENALREREDVTETLDQDRQFAIDHVAGLQESVRKRDTELAEYAQRIVQHKADAQQLRGQLNDMEREYSRAADEQIRALKQVTKQECETKRRLEDATRARAEIEVENATSKECVSALKEEVERLRRQIQSLQQESADKEVKIVHFVKQRGQDKEDLHSLNIALDSKQQELELLKRRLGVKGTAGRTPAHPSKASRREPLTPRPPSVTSDSSVRDRKLTETPGVKTSTLAKSVRVTTVNGSMGPPSLAKTRASGINTPRTAGVSQALSRSSSVRASPTSTPIPHRRVSSLTSNQQARVKIPRHGASASSTPTRSELDEKENVDVSTVVTKRRGMVTVPA